MSEEPAACDGGAAAAAQLPPAEWLGDSPQRPGDSPLQADSDQERSTLDGSTAAAQVQEPSSSSPQKQAGAGQEPAEERQEQEPSARDGDAAAGQAPASQGRLSGSPPATAPASQGPSSGSPQEGAGAGQEPHGQTPEQDACEEAAAVADEPGGDVAPQVQAPWERHVHPGSGRPFFHNRATGVSQWEAPDAQEPLGPDACAGQDAQAPDAAGAALDDGGAAERALDAEDRSSRSEAPDAREQLGPDACAGQDAQAPEAAGVALGDGGAAERAPDAEDPAEGGGCGVAAARALDARGRVGDSPPEGAACEGQEPARRRPEEDLARAPDAQEQLGPDACAGQDAPAPDAAGAALGDGGAVERAPDAEDCSSQREAAIGQEPAEGGGCGAAAAARAPDAKGRVGDSPREGVACAGQEPARRRQEEDAAVAEKPGGGAAPQAQTSWHKYFDSESGRHYFHNFATGVTQWQEPDAPDGSAATAHAPDAQERVGGSLQRDVVAVQQSPGRRSEQDVAAAADEAGGGAATPSQAPLERYRDLKSGLFYLHNPATGVTEWEDPGGAARAFAASQTRELQARGFAQEAQAWQLQPATHHTPAEAGGSVPPWENVRSYCQGALEDSVASASSAPSMAQWGGAAGSAAEPPRAAPAAAAAGPHVHELLAPLLRGWQSKRLGYVEVRLRPGAEAPVVELDVCVPGDSLQVLGRLLMSDSTPQLEVLPFVEAAFAGPLHIVGASCRKRRVVWEGPNGSDDVWDGELLDTAAKADAWVREQLLVNDLGAALAGLDTRAARPPRSCGPWVRGGLTVGLCVSTMNRLWQLRRALPLNLLHLWPHRAYTKIHVVDFGSTDGTLDFILLKCRAAIDVGLLAVYRADEPTSWHASVAKNTAHMVASEDILVNLDSDNLVGPNYPPDVVRHFVEGRRCVQYEDGEGTCGRIAVLREEFHALGGYDEDCLPMGAQDVDLIMRLKQLHDGHAFRKVRRSGFAQAIHNSIEQKVENCFQESPRLRWGQMDMRNREIFAWRREQGQLRRNAAHKQIGVRCRRVCGDGA